jgi:hypothetical protein
MKRIYEVRRWDGLRERAPGTHFMGGWVDPRAGLDYTEKWKFFTLPGLELPPLGSSSP